MTSRDPLRSSTNTINNNKKTNNYINNNSNYYNDIKSKLKTNQFVPLAETKIKEKLNEMQPVLTQSQLKNLDEHKYSSTGATLLDKYFQPYWRWLVEQMPLNLAPNLITVIGLIINVITSTILIIYCPNANEDPPSWALFLCAIGLFIYQSLDAIDGKQARRTNSSTPLGELFDHGCDSISTVFVTVAFCVTLKLGTYPWFMFLACFIGMMAFYTAHWQTYVTGTLKFDKMDVTEAQATIYAIYFLTSIFGDFFWSYTIPIINIELRFLPAAVGIIGSVSSIFSNIEVISHGGKGKNGSSIAGTSIVFPIFPMFLFLFLAFSIANKSNIVYLENICLYTITFGIVWAKITIKLIIAHMTKGEIYLLDSCLIGPVTLLLNQYFSYIIPELIVLYVSLIIATFDLLKYSSKVCYQICTHMNIYLFKITTPPTTPANQQQNKDH